MALFTRVIAKKCGSIECEQFNTLQPKESPSICMECGSPMLLVTKLNYPLLFVAILIFLPIVGIGGYFGYHKFYSTESAQESSFQSVPTGVYQIPDSLNRYIQYNEQSAKVNKPFSIQEREVTVGDFMRYVDSLDNNDRQRTGTVWERDATGAIYSDQRPVESINWQDASKYAEWLGQETNQVLRLPTVEEWIAACVLYAEPQPILNSNDNQPMSIVRGKVDHLIGNLREWSSTPCKNVNGSSGYFVLGENYMTNLSDIELIGKMYCVSANDRWRGIGFRLIRAEE